MRCSIFALLVAAASGGGEPAAAIPEAQVPAAQSKARENSQAGSPGSDWPVFLGPLGTSVSTEKGIITPWPKDGLRVVWHMKTGSGYAPVVVSRGRVFLFDRHEDKARLTCM